MNANFAIVKRDENGLELRYRGSTRAVVGLGMLGMGGLILWGAATHRLNPPFHQGTWKDAIRVVALALALFGVHTLLNVKRIIVDRSRQLIVIEGRIFGVWSRRVETPFRDIKQIDLVWHEESMDNSAYWNIVLLGPGPFGGRALDASSDERYVTQVGEALSSLIGCPLLRTEFSVAAKRQNVA